MNAINKPPGEKISVLVNYMMIILFAITLSGCLLSDVLITGDRPFNVSQIKSIAFLPFSGRVTDCAHEANKALESTLINYFKTMNIKVVKVPPEWVRAMPELVDATGVLKEGKALEIGKIFEVDSFISGSISECHYYNPNIGDGLVFLTVKIYDTATGDVLAQIDGKKIAKSYDSASIGQMTGEIVNAMFTKSRPSYK